MSTVEERIAELEEQAKDQSRRIAELEEKAIEPRIYYRGWRLNEPRFKAYWTREDGELEAVPRTLVERRISALDGDVSVEPLEQVVVVSPTGMGPVGSDQLVVSDHGALLSVARGCWQAPRRSSSTRTVTTRRRGKWYAGPVRWRRTEIRPGRHAPE